MRRLLSKRIKLRRFRASPSMVVAIIALVFAITGGAIAGTAGSSSTASSGNASNRSASPSAQGAHKKKHKSVAAKIKAYFKKHKTSLTGPQGPPGNGGAQGSSGVVQTGVWAGDVAPDVDTGDSFVFAGPTTTVTSTAGQSITASGSAALGVNTSDSKFDLSVCIQPSSGGTVSTLDGISGDFEEVLATTTRIPFAAAMTGTPGAGTWNVGMCVSNTASTLNNNDYSLGYAQVTGGTTAAVKSAATKRHR